jgi:hypothetical protein
VKYEVSSNRTLGKETPPVIHRATMSFAKAIVRRYELRDLSKTMTRTGYLQEGTIHACSPPSRKRATNTRGPDGLPLKLLLREKEESGRKQADGPWHNRLYWPQQRTRVEKGRPNSSRQTTQGSQYCQLPSKSSSRGHQWYHGKHAARALAGPRNFTFLLRLIAPMPTRER